ncbi:MAG: hypothetical protein WCJ84_04140 [Candidatus Peregrinibacteria bacterium]
MNLEDEILIIKQRNAKVEADKAWEISFARKFLLTFITYIVLSLLIFSLGLPHPFQTAIIPAVGFFVSTLSLKFVKEWWIQHFYKK